MQYNLAVRLALAHVFQTVLGNKLLEVINFAIANQPALPKNKRLVPIGPQPVNCESVKPKNTRCVSRRGYIFLKLAVIRSAMLDFCKIAEKKFDFLI